MIEIFLFGATLSRRISRQLDKKKVSGAATVLEDGRRNNIRDRDRTYRGGRVVAVNNWLAMKIIFALARKSVIFC